MRKHFILLGLILATAVASCSKRETPQSPTGSQQPSPTPSHSAVDACTLLTSKEIESVQGEPLKETTPSGKSDGGLAISQCHFALPTFVNSITLRVVQKSADPGGREPKQVWEETFASEKLQEMERDNQKKKRAPQRIDGLGNAAFWIGTPAGGLYARKGNSYIRLSIGGADDQETKLRKCKELAQMVLNRL